MTYGAIALLLMASLWPATQEVRESGRRSQCQNNVRQGGTAILAHESTQGRFTTGGGGGQGIGQPGRGIGRNQPGGWIYCVLPHLDKRDLAQSGHGLLPAQRRAALAEMISKTVAVLHCPSRRSAQPFAISLPLATQPFDCDPVSTAARNDYAANPRDQGRCEIANDVGPPRLAAGDNPAFPWPNVADHTGVIYLRSEVTRGYLVNGSSHTYLVAEKSVSTAHYESGGDHGDDWSLYTGYQDDICRTAFLPPMRDGATSGETQFGSAHAAVFNAGFCDGSCREIAFGIDPRVHQMLANRADDAPLDESKVGW